MSKVDFDTILDECLDRVKAGEPIDSCLSRYPEHAQELEPLLQMVQAIQVLRATEPPRPAALARGRQRFLTEATRLREARTRRDRSLVGRLFGPLAGRLYSPAVARVATMALVAVLAFLVVSGVVVQAAAGSLPGEPLYPVKAVTRQVQLLITFDPQAREAKEEQIQAQQRQEVRAAAERGRVFEMVVQGVIIEAGSGWITLQDGVRIGLTDETKVQGTPVVGHIAEVRLRSEGGRLTAMELAVRKPGTAVVVVVPTATPIPTETATPFPTPTATPRPTNTPQPTPQKPVVREKKPTKTPTSKPTFTPTPTATKTVAAPVRLPVLELTGVIESIDKERGVWVVSGEEILVTSATVITGEPAVGRTARIRTERHPDGTFVALEIVVEMPPPAPKPERVQFSGEIQSKINDTLWLIAGVKVRIDDRTDIKGQLQVGYFAEVDGIREAPDQVYAERITVQEPTCTAVAFEGVISAIDAEAGIWVVGPFTIQVNDATQIDGVPVEGAFAQVEACQYEDGRIVATRIFVIAPTATATPTTAPVLNVTATATPALATPTPVPTDGSNLAPTPTPGTPAPTLEALPTPTP
jgi:hypothetical protein